MRLWLALMLITFNAFAVEWMDLETGEGYKLTQSFQLPQVERSGSLIDLMSGEKVVLKDVVGLDMIRVTLFQFDYLNCPGQELKTGMEIISVKNTTPVVEIGAQLEKCVLEIFIENKDLKTQSFFE